MDNQAYDSENAVLSIIIENPELAYEATGLKAEMFSSIANQQLFGHIKRVIDNGLKPDRTLIENQIREYPQFSEQSDFNYLQYILSQPFAKENFSAYVSMVIRAYKSREMTKLAGNLKVEIKKTENVDTLIEETKSKLERIGDVSGGEGTSLLSDIVPFALQEITSRKDHPNQINWTTGFENLDLITGGYRPGNVWIIAARPSVGKTAWLVNSVLRTSLAGNSVLVFEHEMNKQDLVDRLLSAYCGIDLIRIRSGNLSGVELDVIGTALDKFRELPIYLDTTFGSDVNYLKSTTRKFAKINNVSIVYVDYIQLMVERTDNMTMELGNVSREFKVLSTKLGIQMVVLSQLNRNVESRDDKRPSLSDLRQSGNLEEDADLVAMLFREDMYKEKKKAETEVALEYLIRKHRNGPIGVVPMRMNLATNTIYGDFK